ncbi:stage II sporulation protein R [Sediminibacillus massiliensis]|uniref:stage II sporulation protein R n=1 Tax=Sediminibacillus massiliensis TaxID=1926277 RepID=UPI0009884744|nr:stage II sporulation protein R [Sediminibacillus massiliensis]
MRNYFIYFMIFLAILGAFPTPGLGIDNKQEEDNFQVIPDEAIRLRILANSDNEADQKLKREIRDRVNEKITVWVEKIDDIDEARQLIQDRLEEIESTVGEVLKEKGIDQSYQVEYDKHINFPAKVYGSYVYPAGEYEAILITLGSGKGANWWCVLFPPLCFLDFSNGTSVSAEEQEQEQDQEDKEKDKDEDEVKVKFFFLEWFS